MNIIKLLFLNLFIISLPSAFAQFDEGLGLNQVSVLYPLPKDEDDLKGYLASKDPDTQTEVLPISLLKLDFTEGNGNRKRWNQIYKDEMLDRFRVVAIRIDPIKKELRLVWQWVTKSQMSGKYIGANVSFHSIHRYPSDLWNPLLTKWIQLQKKYPLPHHLELQVHPVLLQEGLKGPFAIELKNLLKDYITKESFAEIALMDPAFIPATTEFEIGFLKRFVNVTANESKIFSIPNVNETFQTLTMKLKTVLFPEKEFQVFGEPNKISGSFISQLNELQTEGVKPNDDLIRDRYNKALFSQNPKFKRTEELDCASCHLARPFIQHLEKSFPELQNDFLSFKDKVIRSEFGFPVNSPLLSLIDGVSEVRAFGYIGDIPMANERTILESAESADAINKVVQ